MDRECGTPVIDCPSCEEKDVVLLIIGPYTTPEGILERIWYCPHCSYVPAEEEIKKYISISESMEMD